MSLYEKLSTPLARKVLVVALAGLFLLNFSIFLRNQFSSNATTPSLVIGQNLTNGVDVHTFVLRHNSESIIDRSRHNQWNRVRVKGHPDLVFHYNRSDKRLICEKISEDDQSIEEITIHVK